MSRWVSSLVLVSCLAMPGACAQSAVRGNPKAAVSDELPPWMTRGEQIRLDVAETLLETQNTIGALEILRSMRAEGYEGPELDLLQGKALRIDGLYEESERLLLRSDEKMRNDPRPASELCVLYADSGHVDDAVLQCRTAVKRDEASAQAWNNLGFLLLAQDQSDEALEAIARAVELDGTNPRFRNNLGLAQATLGRHEAAFRTFQSTLPRALAAFNVAVALERAQDIDGAIAYYERALTFDPQLAEASVASERLRMVPSPTSGPTTELPSGDPK